MSKSKKNSVADQAISAADAFKKECEAAAAEDRPIKITLQQPIELGNTTWATLTLQPLRAHMMEHLPVQTALMKMGDLMQIGQEMAGVPDGVIRELCPEDMGQLIDATNSFLSRIQGAGD